MTGRIVRRLIISTLAAFGAIIIVVLVLTIVDLYLTGHGYQSINQETITWPAAGVSMSISDVLLLVIGLGTWFGTWFLQRRSN